MLFSCVGINGIFASTSVILLYTLCSLCFTIMYFFLHVLSNLDQAVHSFLFPIWKSFILILFLIVIPGIPKSINIC